MLYQSEHIVLTAGAAQPGANKIWTISLTAGVDAATLTISDNITASTDEMWTVAAAIGTTNTVTFPMGLSIKKGIYVALTGTSPLAYAAVDSKTQTTVNPSVSESPSLSPSSTESPSESPSTSPSSTESPSESPSTSPSSTESPSESPSESSSNSPSPTSSSSESPSESPSTSPSI